MFQFIGYWYWGGHDCPRWVHRGRESIRDVVEAACCRWWCWSRLVQWFLFPHILMNCFMYLKQCQGFCTFVKKKYRISRWNVIVQVGVVPNRPVVVRQWLSFGYMCGNHLQLSQSPFNLKMNASQVGKTLVTEHTIPLQDCTHPANLITSLMTWLLGSSHLQKYIVASCM